MNSAILHNGQVVTAKEYRAEAHGNRLYCIDKGCRVPIVFVPGTESITSHFRTTGRNDSKHSSSCGFYKPLDFISSIKKVEEYQGELLDKGIKETIVRINFSKLDPDYVPKEVNRDEDNEKKKKDPNEIKVKQESSTPSTLGSLTSVVKLLTSYEPDVLSTILVNIKGKKIPISSIILDQEKAHNKLWNNELIENIGYFVYGVVESIQRREKVYYINFKPVNNIPFSIVIFDKYFKHFTYKDDDLIGKTVLIWGNLRKNEYNNKNQTEISIKSDRYLEFLKK